MEFWHVANSIDLLRKYKIDWGEGDFKSPVETVEKP